MLCWTIQHIMLRVTRHSELKLFSLVFNETFVKLIKLVANINDF